MAYVPVLFPMVRYDMVTGLPFTVTGPDQAAILPTTFSGVPIKPAVVALAFPPPLVAAVVPIAPLVPVVPAPILAPILANLETLRPKTRGRN